jgi:hypothetical protein
VKIREYILSYESIYALAQLGCAPDMLELAKVGTACDLRFPKFQMSMGYGLSPEGKAGRHIYTWFLGSNGRPRINCSPSVLKKADYYLGVWFNRDLVDQNDPCLLQAKGTNGICSGKDWLWFSAKSSDINKGVANAFFGDG